MRWIALVVVCAGCDHLFDIHSIDIPNTDAVVASDVVPPSDGQNTGHCSAMTMLADDFTIDDLATMWPQTTTLGSNQIAVTGGRLEIRNLTAGSYATLDAGLFYDLRETSFAAAITDDGAVDDNDFVQLEMVSSTGYDLKIVRTNQTVQVTETPATNVPKQLATFPYVANAMKYFRVAELGGTMTVDTSPDAISYTPQATIPDPENWAFARPSIQTHRGTSSPQYTAYVDDVNGGTPSGSACPIAQLRDDFSAPALGSQWANSEAYGGSLTVHDGIADLASDGAGTIALGSSTVYDLRGDVVFVEVPAIAASAMANSVELRVTTATGDKLQWFQSQGTLTSAAVANGASTSSVLLYSPTAMRWWKIGFTNGTLGWATSADGLTWQNAAAQPPSLSGLDRVDVRFIVTSNTGVASDTHVDNVNVHP